MTRCGASFQKYGGHTSAVLVELDSHIVIFDAGTGLVDFASINLDDEGALDPTVFQKNRLKKPIHLFLSHVHTDHIFGLSSLQPLWDANTIVHLYAGTLLPYGGIEKVLSTFFSPPYFPVPFEQFPSKRIFYDFTPHDTILLSEGLQVRTYPLNHPNGAVGYRLETRGKSICYITDYEHMCSHGSQAPERDVGLLHFVQEADLLLYDSTYDDHSFEKYRGWGHSTWQEALKLANAAKVRTLALFHHDPNNNDDDLDNLQKQLRQLSPSHFFAQQGMIIEL